MTADMFAIRRIRTGKTAKDKASGAWARRLRNRLTLAAWHRLPNADKDRTPFPTIGK